MKRVFVVSDLHLGLGRLPQTGRYHRLESFFFDREFRDFINYLIENTREEPARLVLGGDIVDFLRIDIAPDKRGRGERIKPEGHDGKRGLGFRMKAILWKARAVTKAHVRFFASLALWIEAGNEIVWLPGNHDPETRLSAVQEVFREAIRKQCIRDSSVVDEALIFRPWFHFEKNRLWVEHGNQSDPENAFEYPFASELPELTCQCFEDEVDMPVGSWFQRYVYNGLGNVTFQVPAVGARRPYALWLLLNRPQALWTLVRSYIPLWRRLINEKCEDDHALAEARMEETHCAKLEKIGAATSLTTDVLADLSRPLKSTRIGLPSTFVSVYLRRTLRNAALRGLTSVFGLILLTLAFIATLDASWCVLTKSLVLVALMFVLIAAFARFIVKFWLGAVQPDIASKQRGRQHAERIAETVGVPVVILGHYHSEDRFPLPSGGFYINTGTWVPVWNPGDQLRERVQFSFCDLRGREPKLRYWNPDRNSARRVILMEE